MREIAQITQQQLNAFPDVGCEYSFGYICKKCPYYYRLGFGKCIFEYPESVRVIMYGELHYSLFT